MGHSFWICYIRKNQFDKRKLFIYFQIHKCRFKKKKISNCNFQNKWKDSFQNGFKKYVLIRIWQILLFITNRSYHKVIFNAIRFFSMRNTNSFKWIIRLETLKRKKKTIFFRKINRDRETPFIAYQIVLDETQKTSAWVTEMIINSWNECKTDRTMSHRQNKWMSTNPCYYLSPFRTGSERLFYCFHYSFCCCCYS